MSHITTMALIYTDLAALKAAVEELGGNFVENAKTFRSYESGLKCDHKITVPDCNYDIGVTKNGTGFKLGFDSWGPGEKLLAKFGKDCMKLAQMYAVHKSMIEARRHGYIVRRETGKNGAINLQVTVT